MEACREESSPIGCGLEDIFSEDPKCPQDSSGMNLLRKELVGQVTLAEKVPRHPEELLVILLRYSLENQGASHTF